jgi:hypothetical protein
VTIWSGTTEAPDETAYGEWMKTVASAGLAWDRALTDYLAEGAHEVKRRGSTFFGGVTLSLDRPRPPEEEGEEETGEEMPDGATREGSRETSEGATAGTAAEEARDRSREPTEPDRNRARNPSGGR